MRDGEAASLADLRRLQGRWREILETDCHSVAHPLPATPTLNLFSGNTFQIFLPGHDALAQGTFVIDARTDPKSITLIFTSAREMGEAVHGIYDLHDDHLILVTAASSQRPPTEFKAMPGMTLKTFVRD